jgi:Na+/proline symporter
MWSNFYAAGGWGMHPVSVFGFLLIAASVLHALRPQQKTARLALTLGMLTFAAGLLGTFTGICNSAFYIQHVAKVDQVEILALGVEESLHDVVLALILVVIGGLVASVGTLRSSNGAAPTTAAT